MLWDDAQWLYDLDDDRSIYSHDHALYFPPSHGVIDDEILKLSADEPNVLPDAPEGLAPEAVEAVAKAFETIDRDALVNILRAVPAS
ncbi:hypothetical protein ACGFIV_30335 [Sphaerisporangium sp. NPDC049003]|uniref:hypothetical protein n=1 Tax=Sphaerisporangium sp. NPDC049003 TaxID=3364517 RepID=UPI0037225FBC